eukprot:1412644-Pleurochrysis_carterae.AAC.1
MDVQCYVYLPLKLTFLDVTAVMACNHSRWLLMQMLRISYKVMLHIDNRCEVAARLVKHVPDVVAAWLRATLVPFEFTFQMACISLHCHLLLRGHFPSSYT